MLKEGISPNTVTFNTMIHICGSYGFIEEYSQPTVIRMYIDLGMLTRAWVWFERFHLAGGMSYICYAANIDAQGQTWVEFKIENLQSSRGALERCSIGVRTMEEGITKDVKAEDGYIIFSIAREEFGNFKRQP